MDQQNVITTQEFLTLHRSLIAISKYKFSPQVAYRIGRAINNSKSIPTDFEKSRLKVLNEVGTLSEDKTNFSIVGKEEEFQKRMDELLETPVTLKWHKISLESLGHVQIEPEHIAALEGVLIVDIPESELNKAANA